MKSDDSPPPFLLIPFTKNPLDPLTVFLDAVFLLKREELG